MEVKTEVKFRKEDIRQLIIRKYPQYENYVLTMSSQKVVLKPKPKLEVPKAQKEQTTQQ